MVKFKWILPNSECSEESIWAFSKNYLAKSEIFWSWFKDIKSEILKTKKLHKCKHLLKTKFDAKNNWEAILHNQKDMAHFLTVVDEPDNRLVVFFKVGRETGQEVAEKVFQEAIVETESLETLDVIGSGN